MLFNLLVFLSLSCFMISATTVPIRDPETEIQSAIQDLGQIEKRYNAALLASERQGLAPQEELALIAFKKALSFYDSKEWLGSIREFNHYLNLSQVPAKKYYLQAQMFLGRAYEQIGMPSRALRAYLRYLNVAVTEVKPDQDSLIDVLRHSVPLASQDEKSSLRIRDLLSGITSLDLSDEIRAEVLFLAAKTTVLSGDQSITKQWIESAKKIAKTTEIKAKILYVEALLSISINDFSTAEEKLSEAIQVAPPDQRPHSHSIQDLARLALARIYSRKNRRDLAIDVYNLIQQDSPLYRDALFESIYLHLRLKQDELARAKTVIYLGMFPQSPDALSLQNILSFIELRSGNLEDAAAGIHTSDRNLTEISRWLHKNLKNQDSINQEKINEFIQISSQHIGVNSSLQSAQKLFMRFAEANRRLFDTEGELKNLVYTLARLRFEHISPHEVNRSVQIQKLAEEILLIGHRLSSTERFLYEKRLSELEHQKLLASENRRIKLRKEAADTKRQINAWSQFSALLEIDQKFIAANQKINELYSSLTASKFILNIAKDQNFASSEGIRVEKIRQKIQGVNEKLLRNLSKFRKDKISGLDIHSSNRYFKTFLLQYAATLEDDRQSLLTPRENPLTAGEKLLVRDAEIAWDRWKVLINSIFLEMSRIEERGRKNIEKILSEIQLHEKKQMEVATRLRLAREKLEQKLSVSMTDLVENYSRAIDERQAKHKKWIADIEWIRFQKKQREDINSEKHYQLEMQILRDNFEDLQQGILWKWPD